MLDAPDARLLARFYGAVLDWSIDKDDADFCTISPGEGVAYLAFQTSPDYVRPSWPNAANHQQMMMHLDVEVTNLEEAVAHAVELGATESDHQPQSDVRVMLDPAGHPFCLYLGE